MVRRALLSALALLAVPAAAQQADPAPQQPQPAPQIAPPPPPPVRYVPAPRHPQRARAQRVRTVDIPQAAKDEGHNGRATYTATVGPDGRLIALVLKESSMSPAIDEAVRARAEKLHYFPATDKDGNPVQGTVDVSMEYARHDADSPGGGIDTYTCGDMVREYDWFTAANAGRQKLFWPQNAYVSLTSLDRILAGERPSREERQAVRQQREAMWAKLVKRCRKAPGRMMLAEVDQPEFYRNLFDAL